MTNQVAVIDTATNTVVQRVPVGTYPYTTVVSADGSKVYVSNWGGKVPGPTDFTDGMFPVVVDRRTGIPVSGTVSVIDTASNSVLKTIDVGLHPTGMALSPRGDRLYVTNANSDTVSVINTATDAVVKTLHVGGACPGSEPLLGSSPNAVTVSPNGKHVVRRERRAERGRGRRRRRARRQRPVRGLIPTGWYPTAVALDADRRAAVRRQRLRLRLDRADPAGPGPQLSGSRRRRLDPRRARTATSWRVSRSRCATTTTCCRRSTISARPATAAAMATAATGTTGTIATDPISTDSRQPIPMHLGERSPIKHVFYIIKENRTYDQVFGDMPQGNGDPTLVQFGRDVTPNHHALAEQFALLDNYYGPGDQSALGHRWVLQAYPEHVGAQVRQRAQQPEPDAARPDRCDLRQRQGARPDRARLRRARRQHDHAGERDVDRHLQRLAERHVERHDRRARDHRRPARRLSPASIRRPRAACRTSTAPTSS